MELLDLSHLVGAAVSHHFTIFLSFYLPLLRQFSQSVHCMPCQKPNQSLLRG